MVRFALGGVLCLAACYRPSEELTCVVPCDPAIGATSGCPDGLVCTREQLCAVEGTSCQSATDAGMFCFGTGPIRPCFPSSPTEDLDALAGFDTSGDACPLPMTLAGRDVCVVAADQLSITDHARFTGTRPLVILGVTSISVKSIGAIDVGSTPESQGAGSEPVDCTAPPTGELGVGGGGGSFVAGGGGSGGAPSGGATGQPGAIQPVSFRGGCRGAQGRSGASAGVGAGAVYLITEHLILDGPIVAGGGGGGRGESGGGGGGGGSGGYIGIDAAQIDFAARIVATGGGGGGGACTQPGDVGTSADATQIVAVGGMGDVGAGSGGTGGTVRGVAATNGQPAISSCGGGGGGGGVGAIQLFRGRTCPTTTCTPLGETLP